MSGSGLRVHRLAPEWRQGWDELVKWSPQGAMYHLSSWREIFGASCGRRTHYLLADRGGEVVGLLPLVSVRSVLFGSFLVSLPWTSYGGLCGTDPKARLALIGEAIRLAREEKARYIELHSEEPECPSLIANPLKVSMRLSLSSDPDTLWREFPSKLRSQIRRPEKGGLFARLGGVDQLDSFYAVFCRNMRDLGTPVFPRRFFNDILESFPDSSYICCVYSKDRPVAAGLLLGFKDRLEIPWASSLGEFNHLSPNMLLYWQALRLGCEQGYRWFDFGRSTPGGPHYQFKAQWGAEPTQLYWHHWQAASDPLPEMNPQNPRYRLAIHLWRRLPVSLTRLLGPMVARSLP
jgi:FemAB-related protein (PEP-CTERM system-associated)